MAANTAYQDFPRLSAILARHKLMPRQFRNLGDRLVFSNGVIALAVVASLLIIAFDAEVTRLIQLYVVGVFIDFTLSQFGMVRRWIRLKPPNWRRYAFISGLGALTTGVVLVVIASVKFCRGAWIVLIAIPMLVALMASTRRHYLNVADQLRLAPTTPAFTGRNRVVVLVSHLGEATRGLQLRRHDRRRGGAGAPCEGGARRGVRRDLAPSLPRTAAHRRRARQGTHLPHHAEDHPPGARSHPDSFVTVVLPELVRSRRLWSVFIHPHGLMIKLLLLFEPGVVVTDLTQQRRPRLGRDPSLPPPFDRQDAVVLISDVTQPTRNALAYTKLLHTPGTGRSTSTSTPSS